ncbi:MAG: hypothetical protein JSS49_25560 [Planctomycetes bacterium]|nr:hypothetical protein [Planctomycetota bacterium]
MSRCDSNGLARKYATHWAALVLGGAGLWSTSLPANAQGIPATRATYTREETRELLNEYSDSLQDRNRFGNGRRQTVPGNPAGGVTPEMKAMRPLLRSFSENASQLTYSMNDQISRFPGLRSLYTDALTVSAEAIGLDRRASQLGDHHAVLDEFEQLDADWRELAYKLQSVRGLPAETRDSIANLTSLDQQLRNALNTKPQINRQELGLEAAGLARGLQNLQEEIASELARSQQTQQLQIQAGKARQQILTIVSLSGDSQLDSTVLAREFKQFEAIWRPLATALRAQDNSYLERDIRRVSQSATKMHELLLLPQTIDRSQLTFLAASLKKDIDEFFARTPLKLVMHLPKAGRALATADQFYGVCEHFVDSVNRNEDEDHLIEAFGYIEDANRSFADVFGVINSDRAVAVLMRIEQSVETIRSALHVQREDFDRSAAIELAASITVLTEQLDQSTKNWLAIDPQSFSAACRNETSTLSAQSAAIHNDLVRGVPVSQLQREIDETYEHWRTAYKYLIQCQSADDRAILGRLSGRLTPALVELRTMISQSIVEQTAHRPATRR